MDAAAFIAGCAGTSLSDEERRFFADARPFGLIVFKRNVESRGQLQALIRDFRSTVGWDAPVLVDQEGGRVQRLGPPEWPRRPSARTLSDAASVGRSAPDFTLARTDARLIAADLAEVGITVACAPILDLRLPGASDVIGDRGFSADPGIVGAFGRAICEGLRAGGVLPVLKHIPGHGRATVDSHVGLPVVDEPLETLEDTDFRPFRSLSDEKIGMTAHVVYTAVDPDRPATQSAAVVDGIIRKRIGFDGLLLTDDISMGALAGSVADRARLALAAGCDVVLHCNGTLSEMIAVAVEAPRLAGRALERAEAALASRGAPDGASLEALEAELAHALNRPHHATV
jgi:beta-N-acetylhexosaminidase